ncbi:hypothetical protein FGIG_08119 [Fasciola gigantica]|uniref:Uncharacterized protein n=1 Tax=Fasciola gigantica TaxID=46835 RepID=A0A504YMD5_FASGI|nr:hypothetical protein FGIG_08119 [Fasciola gigantica]
MFGHRTQTVALGLHEFDRMKVDVWPSPDAQILDSSPENNRVYQAKRERTVWYHLTNLSANTEHHLTMTVFNEYACEVSKQHVFSTLGDETVVETVLRLSPKDAEMITGQLIQEASVG